jgi:hypothetical protein
MAGGAKALVQRRSSEASVPLAHRFDDGRRDASGRRPTNVRVVMTTAIDIADTRVPSFIAFADFGY